MDYEKQRDVLKIVYNAGRGFRRTDDLEAEAVIDVILARYELVEKGKPNP